MAENEPLIAMFGGKGGVGKTTCASATAYALSNEGNKTLLVSTDPAHSLSDVFGVDIGDDETQLDDDLYGIEIEPNEWFEQRYSEKLEDVLSRANSLGIDISHGDVDDVASEGIVPGADELAVIDLFAEYAEDEDWDAVVFDTAPTGHTLRMLELPDVAGEALSKAAKLKAGVDGVKSVATSLLGGGRGSQDDGLNLTEDIEKTQSQMETVSDILRDSGRTRFNIVTNPERMALAETRRLHDQLRSTDIEVGHVLANKVRMNVDEDCEFCTAQRDEQQELLSEVEQDIDASIHHIPTVPNVDDDERIKRIADEIPV